MNTLTTTQELDSARNFYRGQKLPKAALKIMDAATAELKNSAATSPALQPGGLAPDFILPGVDGRSVRLYTELERGPVVLVFNRGGWCPYCKIHLRGFLLGILYLLILLVVWGACGAIAWYVAPEDRRWTFLWLAFLLLGPLSRLSFLPPRFCF